MSETAKPQKTTTAKDKKQATPKDVEQNFMIQKIFTSDMSWESPNTPDVFKKEWKPDANVELNTNSEALSDEGVYLVSLVVTVTVKNDNQTAFLVEVKQSGIFTIQGMAAEQIGHVVGAYCPTILFPYAREVIGSLVARGGFPELLLAPVNFDALYMHSQQQKDQAKK